MGVRQTLKQIKPLLVTMDLFNRAPSLNFKKQEYYNTTGGVVISLTIIIFTSLTFFSMIVDLYSNPTPNIVSNVE